MREECSGYRDEWDLVFRDQTKHTISRSKAKWEKRAATRAHHLSPPARILIPNVDELGVNYFIHNFVASGYSASSGYLNYIPTVYSSDGEHPTLLTSMAAVGLVALANSTQQPELASHARAKYAEAIHKVNAALSSPVESMKDSTLMSVISLGVFENVSNYVSWTRHIQGAAALIVARGKSQFSTTASMLMFNQVRADLVASCIQFDRPFPDEIWALQEEAMNHAEAERAFWRLGVLASHCANLLWKIRRNHKSKTLPKFLKQATTLQRDFQHIFGILATQEPYTSTQETAGDPDIIYSGRVDLYSSVWAIRVWNNARILQMILCNILWFLLNKALATDPTPAVRSELEQKLSETLHIQSKLEADMLATVPQALGLVSSVSTLHLPVDCSSPASVSGGYLLTWCLYTVGQSTAVKSETRKWIIRRLRDIGKTTGIVMALHHCEDLIMIDRLVGKDS